MIHRRAARLGVAALVVLCVIATGCAGKTVRYELRIGSHTFHVEVADTPESRQQGLMDRKTLAADQGMLFVFDAEEHRSFWMQNTPLPLSIAYIGADLVIDEILAMTPYSTAAVPSAEPAMYALEVNQGRFAELGITPGYRVRLSEPLRQRIRPQ